MSSSFGTLFRVTTFGESHGEGVGAVIDGCPPKMSLDESDIQTQLDRRRPAQSELTTPREEADRVTILSGVDNGITLGTPIALMVKNTDQRPADYRRMRTVPRPSHADYTYQMKYDIQALSGGGRASARETVGRVAAGAVAEKFLYERYGIEIVAWVSAVAAIEAPSPEVLSVIRKDIDRSAVRCPDSPSAEKMQEAIIAAQKAGDSLGGIISCVCRNIPAGLGEPVFDKMEALHAGIRAQ
jgi:chorismate synthase